jgi:hypothetical protein
VCFLLRIQAGNEDSVAPRDSRRPSVPNVVEGLKFVGAWAGMPILLEQLASSAVVGLKKSGSPLGPPMEAVPLPLGFMIFLERLVCNESCCLGKRLLAGFVLFCCWGGLRWSDGQACSPSCLSCVGWLIRGHTSKSKGRKKGIPFAVIAAGFTGSAPGWGWGHHYLKALSLWVARTPEETRDRTSFLLPCTSLDGVNVGTSKASYESAIYRFRMLLREWRCAYPDEYTWHSCKVTLLSWGNTLDLPLHWRRQQGHHAGGSGERVVATYGRDDTVHAIRLQETIIARVRSGSFKPTTPLNRGGMFPLVEPQVSHVFPPWSADEVFSCPGDVLFSPTPPSGVEGSRMLVHEGRFLRGYRECLGRRKRKRRRPSCGYEQMNSSHKSEDAGLSLYECARGRMVQVLASRSSWCFSLLLFSVWVS